MRLTRRGTSILPCPKTRRKLARDRRTHREGYTCCFMQVKTKTSCFTCTAKSVCIESDIVHDYAEIYTPSREKLPWDKPSVNNKPPTPPLHRFPSWESRIYQVANEGLAGVAAVANQAEPTAAAAAVHPSRVVSSQGYCDISVPVYATVKGVSFYRIVLRHVGDIVLQGFCFDTTKFPMKHWETCTTTKRWVLFSRSLRQGYACVRDVGTVGHCDFYTCF